ncbi:DUF2065 domain-containing protein [Roseomonas sp. AR75]|uniref:DUF2065 domain-containing protein n=1 Tax=Roseomonas sp. AR75 TaxID=2562311 RepID=UPI0010C1272A|nr:DUF2065 domain-containing protein [Roseomonas sp. AR75]
MRIEQVLAGLGVVLAVEGLLYAIAPGGMRKALSALAAQPEWRLRSAGLAAAFIGVALAWLLTRA